MSHGIRLAFQRGLSAAATAQKTKATTATGRPATLSLARRGGGFAVETGAFQQALHRRTFSSASAALDEEAYREALYGPNGTSPFTEYFDLAVNHGHTGLGPPPKYQVKETVTLKCGIPEDILTFKTTSYQRLMEAPYVQHQEHKVTMVVKWYYLPLNDFEKRILQEIVGGRYRPERKELRLSSEQFGSRIENKRHLTSMLDRLVFTARKLAAAAGEETSDPSSTSDADKKAEAEE